MFCSDQNLVCNEVQNKKSRAYVFFIIIIIIYLLFILLLLLFYYIIIIFVQKFLRTFFKEMARQIVLLFCEVENTTDYHYCYIENVFFSIAKDDLSHFVASCKLMNRKQNRTLPLYTKLSSTIWPNKMDCQDYQ